MVSLPSGGGCCAGSPGALTAPTRHSSSALRGTAEHQRYARPCSATLGPRSGPLRRPASGPPWLRPPAWRRSPFARSSLPGLAYRPGARPSLGGGFPSRRHPLRRLAPRLRAPFAARLARDGPGVLLRPWAAPGSLGGRPALPLRACLAPVWPWRVPPLPPPAGGVAALAPPARGRRRAAPALWRLCRPRAWGDLLQEWGRIASLWGHFGPLCCAFCSPALDVMQRRAVEWCGVRVKRMFYLGG